MRWYITVTAVREFMQIVGYDPADDGEQFDAAAKWLSEVCETARIKKDQGNTLIHEAKTQIDGKVARLELYVSTAKRPEGPLPQLVRVRYKGGSRSGRKR